MGVKNRKQRKPVDDAKSSLEELVRTVIADRGWRVAVRIGGGGEKRLVLYVQEIRTLLW